MTRVISSPTKRFPGTITLPDFLTIPQARAWEECLDGARALRDRGISYTSVEYIAVWEPGLREVVQAWDVEGFSHDPLQTTPRGAVLDLIVMVVNEITGMYQGEVDDPNG